MKSIKWYGWVIIVLILLLVVLAFQHGVTTSGENAPFAFWPVTLMLGLPALILGLLGWRFGIKR